MEINTIDHYNVRKNKLDLYSNAGLLHFSFPRRDTIRIEYGETKEGEAACILKGKLEALPFSIINRNDNNIEIFNECIRVRICCKPFGVSFQNVGFQELASTHGLKFLETDGKKKIVRLRLDPDERIYGLGQDPMAKIDKRDQERRMWQQWNTHRRSGNAGVPLVLSSHGYGLLLNSSWASRFSIGKAHIAEQGAGDELAPAIWPWKEECEENDRDDIAILLEDGPLDLFLFAGNNLDRLLFVYSDLTGRAPLPPKWAFGLIQCKNRYRSWNELISIAKKYREKKIPCDTLVIDWLWFKNFGDMEWDEVSWADAEKNLKILHGMGFKVLLAEHPFVDTSSSKYEEFKAKGFLNHFPETDAPYYKKRPAFDHTNPEARKEWWKLSKKFRQEGIDGFWTDMGEVQVDPIGTTYFGGTREQVHNIYSLMWAKGLYEGNRSDFGKRMLCLARTTYAGIEKFGAVMWSGDVDSTWQVLKDQIRVGLGVCLSGQQYWCTDVGGFFTGELRSGVKYGNHYQGHYGEGFTPELYIRWFEFGTFCPLFRTHGTRPGNEPWSFGDSTEAIIRYFIELRYNLIPYIYSCAWKVTQEGRPMMRAMCLDYGDDKTALLFDGQYMFGPNFLVAPVVEKGQREKKVYLPSGDWYDFYTQKKFSGPQIIQINAPLDRIPLFVKAGSVIPCSPKTDYIGEVKSDKYDINIYSGADGSFNLYNDDGTTYEYEKGKFENIQITYSDKQKSVSVDWIGEIYDGIPQKCCCNLHVYCVGKPNSVALNGKVWNKYYYDSATGKLEITLPDLTVGSHTEVTFEEDDVAFLSLPQSAASLVADCDMEPSGEVTIHCIVENATTAPVCGSKLSLVLPEGWVVRYCPSEYTGILENKLRYEFHVIPLADAMPVLHHATLNCKLTFQNGKTELLSKTVKWGSGFNTRWSIIGSFPITTENDIDTIFPVETNPDFCLYKIGEKTYYWRRLIQSEYNCFGYVDLRENGFNSNGDPLEGGCYSGIAYAKCLAYSPSNQEGYLSVSAEKEVKIWLNHKVVLESDHILIDYQSEIQISLKEGWNSLLIKSYMRTQRPFSGREFGFNFTIVDKEGQPMENLLYHA